MLKTNTTAEEILSTIRSANNIILCIDERYDYDAFCSALTLYCVIKRLFNKTIKLTYAHKVTEEYKANLTAVLGSFPVELEVLPDDFDFSGYDLMLFSDSNLAHRVSDTGKFEIPFHMKTISIDHHIDSNPCFGDLYYVMQSVSTSSILYKLLEEAEVEPSPAEAELMLVGIFSDSQFFTTQQAFPSDFHAVSKLLELCPKPYGHFLFTYHFAQSIDETKIIQLVYKNMHIDEALGLVYSTLIIKDQVEAGIDLTKKFDASPVDLFFKIKTMKIAFLLKEKNDAPGTFSLSLRSKGDVNIVPLAEKFGGGGHKNAAGGILRDIGSVDKALKTVLDAYNSLPKVDES